MGTPSIPAPVKRVAGVLAASVELLDAAREVLSAAIAPVRAVTEPERWSRSRYYQAEMGKDLWRQYWVLDGLMPPDNLVALKRLSNQLEAGWCHQGQRRVNLDPGYVDLNRLVLATTKDAAHRLYLGQGIFAEVTLRFVAGTFEACPHTYGDYAEAQTRAFFTRVREAYRLELGATCQAAARPAD